MTELGGGYPRELLGITTNLNALLRSERERLARYRNTLGNLAHSFKTPLAVMRNLLSGTQGRELPVGKQLDEQVGRMDDIVKYQLKRAAASGGTGLGTAPVDVRRRARSAARRAAQGLCGAQHRPASSSVADGLPVRRRPRGPDRDRRQPARQRVQVGRGQVRLTAQRISDPTARRDGLRLVVEDDGPGIPVEERARVLDRGARLDERVSGQGIGLSVVRELAQLNGGTIAIDESPLGGARIEVRFRRREMPGETKRRKLSDQHRARLITDTSRRML